MRDIQTRQRKGQSSSAPTLGKVVLRMLLIGVIASSLPGTAFADQNIEKNKSLVRAVFAALESGNVKVLNRAFDPKGKSIIGSIERPRGGPFKTFAKAAPFPAALDKRSVDIESLIAEGNQVAVQSRICGIHARPLIGFKPTGKQLCARYLNLYTIKNGRIVVNAVGFDRELLKKLKKNAGGKGK